MLACWHPGGRAAGDREMFDRFAIAGGRLRVAAPTGMEQPGSREPPFVGVGVDRGADDPA